MKRKIISILFALVLVLSFSLVTAMPVAAATISVPSQYLTIQAAINAANAGDTITVAAGTYEEQLDIGRDLTIQGAGQGNTIIKSPSVLILKFTTPSGNKPIVYVHNSAQVAIQGLTVDGAGRGNGNVRFIGIAFYNAGGVVRDVNITGIRETPLSGVQHGVALYAFNNDNVARTLEVADSTINDYQKNGMALSGTGLTVNVTGNTVTGSGHTTVIAQNGIQVGYDASGLIRGNTVSGNYYVSVDVPGKGKAIGQQAWVACGILLYNIKPGNNGVFHSNNKVQDNQIPIYVLPEGAQGPQE